MKVSIITTCFNRESTVADAIKSVVNQDYDDIEYIIVDGASKDNSVEVINNAVWGHENMIKFVSEPDNGMYEALNKGVRMATGDIIGLCHSDDMIYARDTVKHVVSEMQRTNADFLYADGVYVNPEKMDCIVRRWIGGRYARWKVRMGWLPLHPTCYIKRDVYLRFGLYDESYRIAADTHLLINYLYNANLNITYLPEFVTKMRMGGMSTDSKKRKQMWREDIRAYAYYGFRPVFLSKLMKMAWKIPQYVGAKLMGDN